MKRKNITKQKNVLTKVDTYVDLGFGQALNNYYKEIFEDINDKKDEK
ncbi:MAG TPA: hypothetical protein PLM70_02840 [Bacteroidales bacterium]|nr:hypothetical protein [Bacteroidales bacterium]